LRTFAEMLGESIRKYQNPAIEAAAAVRKLIALAKREANRRSTFSSSARLVNGAGHA
jgi:hypothetical protein